MSDQWLSIVEYARTYGISDMTIRRRIRTGKLEAQLRDGKYFIPVGGHTSVSYSNRSGHKPRSQSNGISSSNHSQQVQRPIIASQRTSPGPNFQTQGSMREQSLNSNPRTSVEHEPSQSHFETRMAHHPSNDSFNQSVFEEVSRNSRSWTEVEDPSFNNQALRRQIEVVKQSKSGPYIASESYTEFPRTMIQELNETANETREVAAKILSFAKVSIQQAKELEQSQSKLSETKNQVLLERIAQKDQTISSLRQQIEDLHLLVQILEKKKA